MKELCELKVYDKVWVMENNKPTPKMVYSITNEMNHMKNGVDIVYRFVDGLVGACSTSSVLYKSDLIFDSKEELIQSLMD